MEKTAKAAKTEEVAVEASPAPKYRLEKLREHTLELFGVTSCVFDGATHGMTGEYTVEEIKNTIKRWGEKEAN